MSRNKNHRTRYSSGNAGNNSNNKPQIIIQDTEEPITITRGNLALVSEARPRKTPATPTIRNKAQSLSLDWDDNEALQIQAQRPLTEAERKETLYQVYVGNTWVSSCVDVISKRFTSGGWHLEEVEEGKGQPANKDILKNFLLNINDDEDFLQYLRGIADDLDIYGESYSEIVLGTDGLPAQLVSIDCVTMTYELDEHGNITKYIQTLVKSGKTIIFKPEQIIRWWFPSKRARKVAFSPIEKLVNPTYADKSMVDWVQAFFRKGTRPSSWVKLGDDSSIDDARQFLKFYRENYTGEQNAHTPQVMYGGAILNEYGKGSIDVDFNNGRLLSREEILAGYGVPPASIAIIESAHLGGGTGEDQDKALRNNTVDPIKQLILEKFNRRIVVGAFGITDWVVTTRYADYRSDKEIASVQQTRIFSGLSTPNQERIEAGKAPYKDTGDTPIVVAGREIIPLDRLDDLTDEQRQAAQIQIQTSKAQAELAQTQADKAKEPTPEPPALSNNANAQNNQQQQNNGKPAPVPGSNIPKEIPQEESYVRHVKAQTQGLEQPHSVEEFMQDIQGLINLSHRLNKTWQEKYIDAVKDQREKEAFTFNQATGTSDWQNSDSDIQSRLQAMHSRGVKTLTWKHDTASQPCPLCDGNIGVTVPLGKPFPNGALTTPAHDHCECGVDEGME
jgi:HK97 family phage portal protein